MRWKLGSIKFRIVAVVILFTLSSALVTVSLSLRQYRQAARRQMLQSTEFNLNLVAGLVNQDLESLGLLRDWCSAESSISSYISGSQPDPVTGARTRPGAGGVPLYLPPAGHPGDYRLDVYPTGRPVKGAPRTKTGV